METNCFKSDVGCGIIHGFETVRRRPVRGLLHTGMTMISQELLDILACPLCKGALEPDPAGARLICPACALAYPVREGIPVMLPEEAERIG